MTAIVGILCRDGVVVGSDSASTSTTSSGRTGIRTIELPCKKLSLIDGRVVVAGTGEVGLHQRFCQVVSMQMQPGAFSAGATNIDLVTRLAQAALHNFNQTFLQKGQIMYGALLGFQLGGDFNLCEFAFESFEPELKSPDRWFASMGSGQLITDPFLGFLQKIFWPPSNEQAPSVSEGTFFATWALLHAIQLNPGGINGPIQMAVITNSGGIIPVARLLEDAELEEHRDSVESAELHLGTFASELGGRAEPPPDLRIPSSEASTNG
jgi:20S proteasome alpha/beta subunit